MSVQEAVLDTLPELVTLDDGTVVEKLFSAEQIAFAVGVIADRVVVNHPDLDEELIVAGVLKGGETFTEDFSAALDARGKRHVVTYIQVGSYGNGTEPGAVELLQDIDVDIQGRKVLFTDELSDKGGTGRFLKALAMDRGASQVELAVPFQKPEALIHLEGAPDYTVLDIDPTHFVIGYGLDDAGKYRELPFVGIKVTPAAGAVALSA